MLINWSLSIEKQNEHNLILRFCLTVWRTFFFAGDCGDFQCMLSCFVARSRWWIQLSSPVITCPITAGSSSVVISMHWSLCFRVRKWGTQPTATLSRFQLLAQNLRQMILKCTEFEQVLIQWCGDLLELQLWLYSPFPFANAEWSSNMGKQYSGFSTFGEGLMPIEDGRIAKSFLISVCFVHQLHSLRCKFL